VHAAANIVEVFEPFLKAYVDEFKFKSVTTDDWKKFLYQFFDDRVNCVMVTYCLHSTSNIALGK